ncbi:MAG: hypothetical protein WD934_00330 [Gemmatimonadales bacterium]
MFRNTLALLALTAVACGGEPADDATARDLSLQPAESLATNPMADQPVVEAPATTPAPRPQTPPRQQPTPPRQQPAPAQPAPTVLSLAEGTVINLAAGDTITSRHNRVGEPVVATTAIAILDAQGRQVIPAGAVFHGTIADLAAAERPGGEGRMVLTFTRVEYTGGTYEVLARTDSLGTHMHGRGVTAGNVATVGAGAAVGAVAGRVIGGNRTGTAVGAAVGAAAGAGIASATRDIDIVLAEGAPIRLVLTAPYTARVLMK